MDPRCRTRHAYGMLNPWRLRLLCQLETLGTVRAVAQSVHQSPSSVSAQLAVLEGEVGQKLLTRTGRSVQLTPNGHLLAARARDILDAIASAESELRTLNGDPTGVVRIASFASAIHSLVVPTAAALRKTHPSIDIYVDELEAHESTSALLRGDADLIITTTDFMDAPLRDDLDVVPLLTDSIVLVAAQGHRVQKQERVDLATMADEAWTFEHQGWYMANLGTHLCRTAGFEPRVVNRFNSYLITLQHVEVGGSITLLPELAVDTRFDVITRGLDPPVSRRVVAALRPKATSRAAVRAVLDGLKAHVAARASGDA